MFSERGKYHRRILRGEVLRLLRKKAGFEKIYEFAKVLGIDQSQYTKYENGGNITINKLDSILDYHKVSPGQYGTMVDDLILGKLKREQEKKENK